MELHFWVENIMDSDQYSKKSEFLKWSGEWKPA